MNTGTQDGPLKIFVYGTLKRGYWNHDRFCHNALYIEEARVRGRLHKLSSGIPVLQVPDTDILAVGTSDPRADVATQERFSGETATGAVCAQTCWQMIKGELVVFPDPLLALPPIDQLEGFRPGSPSLYRRVLVPIITDRDEQMTAWCYVGGESALRSIVSTEKTYWP
jgi:gamma-glutamylcyclotransferase (GGCT)/AIG2-like uncharacterized protein YtfP